MQSLHNSLDISSISCCTSARVRRWYQLQLFRPSLLSLRTYLVSLAGGHQSAEGHASRTRFPRPLAQHQLHKSNFIIELRGPLRPPFHEITQHLSPDKAKYQYFWIHCRVIQPTSLNLPVIAQCNGWCQGSKVGGVATHQHFLGLDVW